jgi:hypothetical protein
MLPKSILLSHAVALDNVDAAICPASGASPRRRFFCCLKQQKPAPFLTSNHVKNHPITAFLQLRKHDLTIRYHVLFD